MSRHNPKHRVVISGPVSTTVRVRQGENLTITSAGVVEPTAPGATGVVIPTGAAGAHVTNRGTIIGGAGQAGGPHEIGGTGLGLLAAATVRNVGMIAGGASGDSRQGGTGVYIDGGTLITAGTIAGGVGGNGVTADAVWFGATAGRLVIDPGAVFVGNVAADAGVDDVLELSGTTAGTLSGLGSQFTGFSTITERAGANWTLSGPSFLGAQSNFTVGGQLQVDGTFDVAGMLTNNSYIEGASYATRAGALAIDVTGGTLTNGGIITGGEGGYGTNGYAPTGGNGVDLNAGTLISTGTLTGGLGGSYGLVGGTGGTGVGQFGGVLDNSGYITGGLGGNADYFAGSGIVSGNGVDLASGTLTNSGTIAGGIGNYGRDGNGGLAGDGIVVSGGMVINTGVIAGGIGGPCYDGTAGDGGIGVVLAGGAITNQATIAGGEGGGGVYAYAGNGGAGVVLSQGATLMNQAAIAGGAGGPVGGNDAGFYYGGNGGAGLILTGGGGTVVNDGSITGGAGGYAASGYGGGAGGAGVELSGGTLIDSGTISGGAGGGGQGTPGESGDAMLFGAEAATLSLLAGAAFNGDVIADPNVDDVLVLRGSADGTLNGLGTQITGFTTIEEYGGTTWTLTGDGTVGAATGLMVYGAVDVTGSLSFLGGVSNEGTIDATSGTLTFGSMVTNFGTLAIGAAGALSLLAGSGAEQIVDFQAATGMLNLADPTSFAGLIDDFGGSDQIDLLNTAATDYSFAKGVLTVTDSGSVVASLRFEGSYSKSNFALMSDNHGGTIITFK